MKYTHLYLDLDRTLFMTEKAKQVFGDACKQLFGLDTKQLIEESTAFRVTVGDQHFYRFFDQLAGQGIAPSRAKKELAQALKGQDFLYPDARELLSYLDEKRIMPTILTLGDHDYQTFKASLVPELAARPIVTVEQPKAIFLQTVTTAALIVDDHRVVDLAGRHRLVLIDREQSEPFLERDEGYTSINSLALVKYFL